MKGSTKMKKILVMILACSMLLALVACGGDTTAPSGDTASAPVADNNDAPAADDTPAAEPAPGSDEELTIWWLSDADAELGPFMQIWPSAQIVYYPGEDLKTQSRMAVNSGTAPDIFITNAGSIFQDFQREGALMDLTDIIAAHGFMDRINPDYIKPYTVDGKYYAFPTAPLTTWMNLYVNKDALAEAGVTTIPGNLQELISVSEQLTAAGIAPVAFGDRDGWPAILLLGDFFAQQVSSYALINDLNFGRITFPECTEFVNAMKSLIELGQNNVFMPGWTAVDHAAAIQTFAAGQTGYLYNGSWWSAVVDDVAALDFDLDVIWLPLGVGATEIRSIQASSDMAFVANASSTNLDGIIAFLDFVSSEERSILGAERNNAFSVYPGANEKVERHPVFNQPEVLDQFNKPALGPFFDWVFPTPVTELLKVKIVECIDGTTTLDQALADLQAELDNHVGTMEEIAT